MPITPWEDRRGLFQRGREVHDPSVPSRRLSESSIAETLTKTFSNTSAGDSGSVASPTSAKTPFTKPSSTSTAASSQAGSTAGQRRRSSAASSQASMFGNLTSLKRGSQDYTERRSSIDEMSAKSGMFSNLWNTTVRGSQGKPKDPNVEIKRGVME